MAIRKVSECRGGGGGKLRAASLPVCESASLRVVRLYSASHVHDMAQRP